MLLGVAVAYAISRYACLLGAIRLVRRDVPGFSPAKGIALLLWGAAASSATAVAIHHESWDGAVACGTIFLIVWSTLLWRNRVWVRRALWGEGPSVSAEQAREPQLGSPPT